MNSMFKYSLVIMLFWSVLPVATAQQEKATKKPVKEMKTYDAAIEMAQQYARKNNFNQAEAAYKTATAMQPDNPKAIYNLGNLYYTYNKQMRYNAVEQYKKALEKATTKEDKHRIYHNMGNAYLENKQYAEAVAAYKQSLRNDPTDDETRYNLALAKQEQEKNGGGGDDGKEKDKNNGNGDSQSPENKEGDKDQNADGKNKGDQNQKDGNDKEGGDGDKKDSDKGKNTEGDDGNGKPNDNTGGKAPKRVDGKLTPQQIKQLLDAMNNEEQKVQNKVNGKKAKGKSTKNEKDW